MRLSFNEIRARAARFAAEYADASYEKGETQTFYNDFFHIFGVQRRSVARYEEHVKKLNNKTGFIDLFWPRVLLVEQKSAGRDLAKAEVQAGEYFDAIKEADRPRFQLLSDFQTFQLLDRDTRETSSFALADLPKHVEKFGFIMGMERRSFKDQDPVNIKAAELVGRLHDSLEASGYKGHQLEVFLTRIVFCLFADDTGIFEPRDIFLDFLETRTKEDGSDIGPLLAQLFDVLDTPEDRRQTTLDEDLARFPYVNGALFSDTIRTPAFDAEMRQRLLDAGRFNWSGISPAIFGSLFQSVMDKQERREAGAHSTAQAPPYRASPMAGRSTRMGGTAINRTIRAGHRPDMAARGRSGSWPVPRLRHRGRALPARAHICQALAQSAVQRALRNQAALATHPLPPAPPPVLRRIAV